MGCEVSNEHEVVNTIESNIIKEEIIRFFKELNFNNYKTSALYSMLLITKRNSNHLFNLYDEEFTELLKISIFNDEEKNRLDRNYLDIDFDFIKNKHGEYYLLSIDKGTSDYKKGVENIKCNYVTTIIKILNDVSIVKRTYSKKEILFYFFKTDINLLNKFKGLGLLICILGNSRNITKKNHLLYHVTKFYGVEKLDIVNFLQDLISILIIIPNQIIKYFKDDHYGISSSIVFSDKKREKFVEYYLSSLKSIETNILSKSIKYSYDYKEENKFEPYIIHSHRESNKSLDIQDILISESNNIKSNSVDKDVDFYLLNQKDKIFKMNFEIVEQFIDKNFQSFMIEELIEWFFI